MLPRFLYWYSSTAVAGSPSRAIPAGSRTRRRQGPTHPADVTFVERSRGPRLILAEAFRRDRRPGGSGHSAKVEAKTAGGKETGNPSSVQRGGRPIGTIHATGSSQEGPQITEGGTERCHNRRRRRVADSRYGMEHLCHHEPHNMMVNWLRIPLDVGIERLYRQRYLHRGDHGVRSAVEPKNLLWINLPPPRRLDSS